MSAPSLHMVRYYVVKGRVQGVGFRWLVHREAGLRGLKGWVRNTEGGEVEVMVAGSPEQLAELRARTRTRLAWQPRRCGPRTRHG